jgi:regulator of protease activity HflC (stomatin/prohibitin superfamily)
MMIAWVVLGVVLIAFLIVLKFVTSMIKISNEYERLVVFRLGRCIGARGPGLVWLIPVVDQPVWVDLRERYLEVPRQTCITKDNAAISIDFLVYWKVTDPVQSVVQVQNFAGATQGIATTTLRSVVGDISLDDVLAKREDINNVLRGKLDEVPSRWGGKVTSVEIREIEPPKDVQDAMTKQMSAERSRRAVVTAADGDRQAKITVADGEKQAAILKAEGDKQSAILRAEGYALAQDKIFSVAKTLDANTMSLQYLETLKTLGAGPATKFIFPMEFASFLKPFASFGAQGGASAQKWSPARHEEPLDPVIPRSPRLAGTTIPLCGMLFCWHFNEKQIPRCARNDTDLHIFLLVDMRQQARGAKGVGFIVRSEQLAQMGFFEPDAPQDERQPNQREKPTQHARQGQRKRHAGRKHSSVTRVPDIVIRAPGYHVARGRVG